MEKIFTELVWDATPTSYVSHYEVYVNNELLKQIPKNQSSTILDQVSPYKLMIFPLGLLMFLELKCIDMILFMEKIQLL